MAIINDPTKKTTITLKLPELYPKQREFIDCTARYTVVEAATKVGKTVSCLAWLFSLAMRQGKPGRNYWWVAPVSSQAEIAYNRLKTWLLKYEFCGNFNEAKLFFRLFNGAVIWFKSADKPDSLYGEDVYGAVIDEASRCKESSWYAVRTTLTATGAPVKIIGNVRGKKNWAYKMARKAESGERNMAYFRLTAYDAADAGIYTLAEIEDAKRNLPENAFKELYLAEAADNEGNPFGIDAIRSCVIDHMPTSAPVVYGGDLAKSTDWTVAIGLTERGEVCRVERWQSDWGATRSRLVDIIGDVPALIDSTGVGDPIVEDLQNALPNVEGQKFSATSKQQLMEGLAYSLQQGRLRIPSQFTELLMELENFEYQYTATGVKYSAPSGMHDDCVCALALANKQLFTSRATPDIMFF